jgi:hypothetical protein
MRREGAVELTRRAVSLLLLVIAAVKTFADVRGPAWIDGLLWAVPAVAIYLLIPRPSVPEGALRHEPLPSTVMPDMLGFMLGVTFFALPLVIINSDPSLEGVWFIPLMFWLLGLFALAILYMAARYACSWVLLRNDGIAIAGLWRVVDLPFAEITRVTAIERRLPRWVAPALVLVGGWRGAGVALLHAGRAAHYLEFERKSGPPVRFSVDAFPALDRVVRALDRAGVSLDAELGRYARKISRKRKPHHDAKPSSSPSR